MISVVIPTCDRDELLGRCLDRLAPGCQSTTLASYEVIVSDDSKSGKVDEMIRATYPWVSYVKGPRRGPGANRNNGARHAKFEWLAFTDDDCVPDSTWLDGYVKAVGENSTCLVYEGKTYADRPKMSFADFAPINERGGSMPSCNFMIQKSLFESSGGFDEDFKFSYEDVEFFYRLRSAGHDVVFASRASVCHPWRQLPKGRWWRDFRREKVGLLTFIDKHPHLIFSLNSLHYLKVFCTNTLSMGKRTIEYRGAGLVSELRERFYELEVAVHLLPRTIQSRKKGMRH